MARDERFRRLRPDVYELRLRRVAIRTEMRLCPRWRFLYRRRLERALAETDAELEAALAR